jgi:5'-nucleotidase / UDP-sugar diphosphatase
MVLTLSPSRTLAAVVAAVLALAVLVAPPPARAQDDRAVAVDRIAGATPVETAVAVSQAAFDETEAVVVARPDSYPDALAGGPLAAALGAPILFAGSVADLDGGVLDEVDRLGADEVIVLGGPAAVPEAVVDALGEVATVERIEGSNRFGTAQAVATRLDALADVTGVVVVEGRNADPGRGFPDAVSSSWWAGQQGLAILPVAHGGVPAGTLETITALGATNVTIVGGPAAVSPAVEAVFADEALGLTVARFGGADRYDTSATVWDAAVAQGANPVERWFATGEDFPDALAAGPAVAAAGYSFALMPPSGPAGSLSTAGVAANAPEYLDRFVILGGPSAIDPVADAQLQEAASDAFLGEADYCLTVLHNNDGESQLPYASSGEDYGGVARFASVVERERRLAEDGFSGDGCAERQSILLNSGDNFLASPELAASQVQEYDPWYDVLALDEIGYDAFAVGNHEFDFGPEVLAEFIGDFGGDAIFVSANLITEGTVLEGQIVASVTVEKGSRTIGVVGATTPALPSISSPEDVGVQDLATTIATVNDEAARLRAEDGADIVILQSHLQNIDEDIELIAQTSDIDIAIAGGGDELLGEHGNLLVPDDAGAQLPAVVGPEDAPLPGTYPVAAQNADDEIVPVVTTTGDYRYVGRLRARFDADNTLVDQVPVDPRRSRLVRVAAQTVGPDGVEPHATIQSDVVEPVLDFTAGLAEQIVATTQIGLNGVRTDVRTRETNVGALLTDSYIFQVQQNGPAAGLDTAQPIVAIANGGGIRNDSVIAEGGGQVSVQDTYNIAPFGNTVVAFDGVTASQLLPLLERGYSGLPDAAGQFAQVGGMTVAVDPSQTAQVVSEDGVIQSEGSRVRTVTLGDGTVLVEDGAVVDDTTTFILATVNFTAAGGDAYPFADVGLAPDAFVQVAPSYQQSLQEWLTELGTVTAAAYPEFPDRIVFIG